MTHFDGEFWRLLNCRIIQKIVTVFNNRHTKAATTYTFFCSVSPFLNSNHFPTEAFKY